GRSTAGPTDRRGAGAPHDDPRAATRPGEGGAYLRSRTRPPSARRRRAGAPHAPGPQGETTMRGDGRIFRKPGTLFWHMAYYVDGREVSESTKETDEDRARRVLHRRLEAARRGETVPHESRVVLGRVPKSGSCGVLL